MLIIEKGKKLANNFARAFARASRFWILYVSLQSLHGFDVEMPSSTFCWEREDKTTTLFLFSWTSIQFFKNCQHLPAGQTFRVLN